LANLAAFVRMLHAVGTTNGNRPELAAP
jgi:hypothetical protein